MSVQSVTWTEQHRRECEARHVISLPNVDARRAYLERIENSRGQAAREQLEKEILKQWTK